jgi:hypothetical protein
MPHMRRYTTICPEWSLECVRPKIARSRRAIVVPRNGSISSALSVVRVAMALCPSANESFRYLMMSAFGGKVEQLFGHGFCGSHDGVLITAQLRLTAASEGCRESLGRGGLTRSSRRSALEVACRPQRQCTRIIGQMIHGRETEPTLTWWCSKETYLATPLFSN